MTEKYSAYEKNAIPTLTMKIVFGISLTKFIFKHIKRGWRFLYRVTESRCKYLKNNIVKLLWARFVFNDEKKIRELAFSIEVFPRTTPCCDNQW